MCNGYDIETALPFVRSFCFFFLFQMSSSTKRILNDLTNEKKRLKNDSGIDLNFDIGGLKQEKSQSSYSISTSSGTIY